VRRVVGVTALQDNPNTPPDLARGGDRAGPEGPVRDVVKSPVAQAAVQGLRAPVDVDVRREVDGHRYGVVVVGALEHLDKIGADLRRDRPSMRNAEPARRDPPARRRARQLLEHRVPVERDVDGLLRLDPEPGQPRPSARTSDGRVLRAGRVSRFHRRYLLYPAARVAHGVGPRSVERNGSPTWATYRAGRRSVGPAPPHPAAQHGREPLEATTMRALVCRAHQLAAAAHEATGTSG
jgi:hypothetical protein